MTFGERGFEIWLDGVMSASVANDYCWSNRTGLTGNVQPIVIGARTAGASIGLADNITNNHVGYIREVALFAYQLEGADIAMLALEAPVAWPLVPVPNTMVRAIR